MKEGANMPTELSLWLDTKSSNGEHQKFSLLLEMYTRAEWKKIVDRALEKRKAEEAKEKEEDDKTAEDKNSAEDENTEEGSTIADSVACMNEEKQSKEEEEESTDGNDKIKGDNNKGNNDKDKCHNKGGGMLDINNDDNTKKKENEKHTKSPLRDKDAKSMKASKELLNFGDRSTIDQIMV